MRKKKTILLLTAYISSVHLMIESHLVEGRQDFKAGAELTYGQSITDACIGWDDSVLLLRELAQAVKTKRNSA